MEKTGSKSSVSTRLPSPTIAVAEPESLNSQIERLNQYIETIMEQEHPHFSTLTPRADPGESWSIDDPFSEIQFDQLSKLGQPDIERALMMNEDYRSFELRAHHAAAHTVAPDVSLHLSDQRSSAEAGLLLTLDDLARVHSQAAKLIRLAEAGVSNHGELSLGSARIRVTVLESHPLDTTKEALSKNFSSEKATASLDCSLPMFRKTLNHMMQASFQQLGPEPFSTQLTRGSPNHLQFEARQLQAAKAEVEAFTKELQWEASQLALHRKTYTEKEQQQAERQQVLDTQSQLLKQRRLLLEKDKERFEQALEEFNEDKKKHQQTQDEYREKVMKFKEELLELMDPNNVKEYPLLRKLDRTSIGARYARSAHSSPQRIQENQASIEELTQQIQSLEAEIAACPRSRREPLELKLARLQTQVSNLRSQNAIASTIVKSNTIRCTMNKVEHTWEEGDKRSLTRSCHSSPARTIKSLEPVTKHKAPKPPKPVLTYQPDEPLVSIFKKRLQDSWRKPEGQASPTPVNESHDNSDTVKKEQVVLAQKAQQLQAAEQALKLRQFRMERDYSALSYQRLYIDSKLSVLINNLF